MQMASPQLPEMLEDEVELLSAMYEESVLTIKDDSEPVFVELQAFPRTAADPRIFCGAVVRAEILEGYPTVPARFRLVKTQGLDDAQISDILRVLEEKSMISAEEGQAHVSHLFQVVEDFLSARNMPATPCPVCLEPFDLSISSGPFTCIMLEPCLHCIHAGECFDGYYTQLIRSRREKEARLRTTLGTAEAERKAAENWNACPVCRSPFHEGKAKASVRQAMTQR